MVLSRLYTTFLLLALALSSLVLPPALYAGDVLPASNEQEVTPETTATTAKPWQKKKKKKPTIAQSWKKVFTGDWASLNRYDNRNLMMSAVVFGSVYTLYYYCLRSPVPAANPNPQPNGQNKQIQNRQNGQNGKLQTGGKKKKRQPAPTAQDNMPENEEDIDDEILTPLDTDLIDFIDAIPKHAIPCIHQGPGTLTCGNHAFINTKWILEQLENFPNTQSQELGIILAHSTMPAFIQQEIAQHDQIVSQNRTSEIWKAYIVRQLTNSLAKPQSTWQWFAALFGLGESLRPEDRRTIDNVANLLHNITYTQKRSIDFSNGNSIVTIESIKGGLSPDIDATPLIVGKDKKGATPEEKAANTATAKRQCKNILDRIDLNAWQKNIGDQLMASDAMLKKAMSALPRGRDLDSAEIGSLVGHNKLSAIFTTKIKRDANGKPITDDIDNQVPHFVDQYNNPTDINNKILIIENSIQLLIKGATPFNNLKAVKLACANNNDFCFGFILRLSDPYHDYERLKTITDTTPFEKRHAIIAPMVNQDVRGSTRHWISVVLHRINGQNHYYVTDSMDASGTTKPKDRVDVRILIEALETDNSY